MLWVHVYWKRTILLCAALTMPVLLSGCANGFLSGKPAFNPNRVIDYATFDCTALWQTVVPKDVNNTAYWLSLMECVKQLSLKETQIQAASFVGTDWVTLFKRSILLAHISGTEVEQRKLLTQLGKASNSAQQSVKQLVDLWNKKQQLQLSLQAEKVKYQRLKDTSETHIKELTDELGSVKVKLQSLTDIETEMIRKTTPR